MQETSEVLDKIIEILEKNEVRYNLLEHDPVFTSEDAARIRRSELKQGAKAIIFMADDSPLLIVIPGNRHVDAKKFKKTYHIRDLRLLKPEEVTSLTGLEIGAIPPFGNVMNIATYMDEELLENSEIAFNAGSHTKSIKMNPEDYVRICQPIIGRFSQ